ncbi:YkoF family thiamine/hydroxymethylpyrimidine-binding protein [Alkaliphilus transvaalensis]|uniref:YkoF family thiamine/hydroxymethylpyrimidine-binding protein n=1 Tax=Alkaliphilus transvaalensis TaxID=114628 RepID=UPI00055864B9|nr:YkoF family thiamine/hydroxymethylpyrimidine-binding protein [Alkaliphilus transvaalensis]
MRLHAEVALYPLKTNNASQVINDSINTLQNQRVTYNVGSMDTHIQGNDEEVWNSLRNLFDEAQNSGGEVSMVVTITNAAD